MRLTQLNGLLAFVMVAEKRGFSSAARALGVSASALRQAIRSLEARIGVPLFVRTTRSVSLTEAGEQLLAHGGPSLKRRRSLPWRRPAPAVTRSSAVCG